MKLKIIIIFFIAFSLLFAGEKRLLDRIVAKVGREIILDSELQSHKMQLKTMNMLSEEMTESDILDQMIESRLIIQKAKELNYSVDAVKLSKMVDDQIDEIRKQFSSESEMRDELNKAGLDILAFRRMMEDNIREERLKEQIIQSEIRSKIHLTEAEIEEYYEDNKEQLPQRPQMDKLGMIMRQVDAGKETETEALKKINTIMDKIREGVDFEKLARQESEGPSASRGGDIGFFGRGAMVKPFEEAAYNLRLGETSDVVRTSFGFHIIRKEEDKGNEIRVRHILIKVEPTEMDYVAELKLMESVLEKLNIGEDFTKLAQTYSEDDSTAVKGGIMGEFPPDNYPELFMTQLTAIDYGCYTEVIQKGEFLYIFAKLESIPERAYNYNEIEEQLRIQVKNVKQHDLYKEWIRKLKKSKYVEVYYL
ncbi:MAG: peptidylprolyl isomerase [Candidatus Cloacimonetes bacterium]|nr:peptidylprolyl isomerase [Candidatus Cloacimonadota bacterium]